MRTHRRANKVTNKAFQPTDPRRHEPGKQSVKRIGFPQLPLCTPEQFAGAKRLVREADSMYAYPTSVAPMIENAEQARALREPARGSLEDVLRGISQSARQYNHTMERTLREGVAEELRARGFEVKEMDGGVFIKW